MDSHSTRRVEEESRSCLFPDVTKVLRNHPGKGTPVVDWFIRGTLHRDGVVVFPFASKSKSIDVIMYTILCCNGIQRKDQAFTFFVSICPKNGKLGEAVFNYIQQNTLLTGLEGCYFYTNGQWNHLMFGECGLVCDYASNTEIAGHSHASADDPCLWCHALRRPFNPFIFNYEYDMSIVPDIIQKTFPSSLHFLHPHSFYRLISYLYHQFPKTNDKIKLIKASDDTLDKACNDAKKKKKKKKHIGIEEKKELTDLCGELVPLLKDSSGKEELRNLLRVLCCMDSSSCVFWHPIVLSEVAIVHLTCEQMLKAYKDLGWYVVVVSLIGIMSKEVPNVPCLDSGDTAESVLKKYPSIIRDRITVKKEKLDSRGIDQEKNTFLHKSGFFLIDPMHAFSNAFVRMASVITNTIKTKASKRDKTTKDAKLFVSTFVFRQKNTLTKMPGTVGSIVTSMAAIRLQEIGSLTLLPWVSPKILDINEFSKLTCEQRITFYFCFFTVVYRDSIEHPVIFAISHIIPLIAEMVVFRRNRSLLATLQARLTIFLSILEQNCREDVPAECLHLLNHLYDDIIRGGEKSAIANFITERLYHLSKMNGIACRNPIQNLKVRIDTLSGASILSYMKQETQWAFCIDKKWSLKEVSFTLPEDEKECIEMSLLADYQFYWDDSLMVLTYLDESLSPSPNLEEWKRRNGSFKLSTSIEWADRLYSRITWDNKVYKSIPLLPTGITLDTLKNNWSCIGYKMGYNRTLLVFAILGYKMLSVNGFLYPVALCVHLPVSSLSSQSFTYHTVVVNKEGLPSPDATPRVICVPLCQLNVGMLCLYQDETRTVLSPGKIWLFHTNRFLSDEMIESLRNRKLLVCLRSIQLIQFFLSLPFVPTLRSLWVGCFRRGLHQ